MVQGELDLYYYPFCVLSRSILIILREKMLNTNLIPVKFWDMESPLYNLCPLGTLPILIEKPKNTVIIDSVVIADYLEENYPNISLMGRAKNDKLEIKRLQSFANSVFYYEAVYPIIYEKIFKSNFDKNPPDSNLLRKTYKKLDIYLEYIAFLSERRKWLGGEVFSVADICIAASISCLDYLGDINWNRQHASLKDWYVKIKSRPSFKGVLELKIPNNPGVPHYTDLDF